MGKYSVPEEIRVLRPEGTQVKRLGNHYYVYETSSTKKKMIGEDGAPIWKSVTKSGKCIGSITAEGGFIPNSNMLHKDEITVLAYGDYAFALKSTKTLDALKKVFNLKDAQQIYVAAVITVIEGFTYMQDMSTIYKESFLSREFPDVKVGEDALRTLYEDLGKRGEKPGLFQQNLIDSSSKKVSFDGHVIACTSEKNDLSAYGYKATMLKSEQINWMTAYDLKTKKPLASEMFNGSEPDKVTVRAFFDRFNFSDTLFVVDRGFNTESNKELFTENGNSFIVPMISNRNDYAAAYENIKFDRRRSFVYTQGTKASLIYYQEFTDITPERRYLAFRDTTRAAAERETYLKNLQQKKEGFSEEKLHDSEKDFGLFLMETSDMTKTAQQIFCDYKSRWQIETFYNYIDNTIDFNSLYQQDYCRMQGVSFIIQVAGMIYHELRDLTDPHNLSLKAVMKTFRGLKLSKERKRWLVKNAVKSKRILANALDLSLTPSAVQTGSPA